MLSESLHDQEQFYKLRAVVSGFSKPSGHKATNADAKQMSVLGKKQKTKKRHKLWLCHHRMLQNATNGASCQVSSCQVWSCELWDGEKSIRTFNLGISSPGEVCYKFKQLLTASHKSRTTCIHMLGEIIYNENMPMGLS